MKTLFPLMVEIIGRKFPNMDDERGDPKIIHITTI